MAIWTAFILRACVRQSEPYDGKWLCWIPYLGPDHIKKNFMKLLKCLKLYKFWIVSALVLVQRAGNCHWHHDVNCEKPKVISY